MTDYAIELDNVGKKYFIGSLSEPRTLQSQLMSLAKAPYERFKALYKGKAPTYVDEEFWAIRNIDLKIKAGESVGIIGRNGSGKSTILQLVSHVTTPTEGQIITRGRLIAMLNVGTGFHGELTGRENVYVNGAVLGKSVAEIDEYYDDIVEFSEIGPFMDTPLKRYSTGMRVRLAFSVAIHIKPEIIILDEVLAVGDPIFREKCLDAMIERHADTTVLIVSHNVHYLKRVCDRMIWLEKGAIYKMGDPDEIVQEYWQLTKSDKTSVAVSGEGGKKEEASTLPVTLDKATLINPIQNEPCFAINSDIGLKIHLEYTLKQPLDGVRVTCEFIHRDSGITVYSCSDADIEPRHLEKRPAGQYSVNFHTPENLFTPGQYYLDVIFDQPETDEIVARWLDTTEIRVVDNRSTRSQWFKDREGFINYSVKWEYDTWADSGDNITLDDDTADEATLPVTQPDNTDQNIQETLSE